MERIRFTWDGTFLGIAEDLKIHVVDGVSIAKVFGKNVIISPTSNLFTCFIDELKPLFGLEKTGTHYIQYQYKWYTITKIRNYKKFIANVRCSDEKLLQTRSVQRLFAFYELVGVSVRSSNIIEMSGKIYGYNEKHIHISPSSHNITKKVTFIKIFESNFKSLIKRIIELVNDDVDKIYDLRKKVERVSKIYKIEYMASEIIDKVEHFLSYAR